MKDGIWVIGDVHGEFDKLVELLKLLPENAQICFTGDLIDRGKDSAKVLELILSKEYPSILGNHELMMLRARRNSNERYGWELNGGDATLNSYKDGLIPAHHLEFLANLPFFKYFEFEGYKPLVVSHSYIHHEWINKDHIYCEYDGGDILWRHAYNREHFDKEREIKNNIFNIFGHTALKEPLITDTYAMIDTGACYVTNKDLGYLSAIHYPSLTVKKVF